jgi:hypothetical protein
MSSCLRIIQRSQLSESLRIKSLNDVYVGVFNMYPDFLTLCPYF